MPVDHYPKWNEQQQTFKPQHDIKYVFIANGNGVPEEEFAFLVHSYRFFISAG